MLKHTKKQEFIDSYLAFSSDIHAEGSNTAPSYVAALKKIDTALHLHGVFLAPNESVWEIRDVERLAALYEFVKCEQKKDDGGNIGVIRNLVMSPDFSAINGDHFCLFQNTILE